MKRLTALLLTLALALTLASCASDQPTAPSQTELAESYLAELRAIFDATGIPDPAPSSTAHTSPGCGAQSADSPGGEQPFDRCPSSASLEPPPAALGSVTRRSTFVFDESVDPPAFESVELSYGRTGSFDGTFELASAVYAAVLDRYGEPDDHPVYGIQGLIDLGSAPATEEIYFDWWTLADRTLTLNVRFLNTRPSSSGITLTLEPLAEPLPAPPTAVSHNP